MPNPPKTESGGTIEVASVAMCSFTKHPGLVKPVLLIRLLCPKIVERYPNGQEFDDVEHLEDREGEPFIIRGKGKMPERMRDDELGLFNWKRPRSAGYKADDEDSDARLHPNLKRPKRYVIVSNEEEKPSEPEDDTTGDLDYSPFFKDEATLFQDPREKWEESAQSLMMTKEESIGSNAEEKPPRVIGQLFKEVNENNGFVEHDWYEPSGTDSLWYHYSEDKVEYILRRCRGRPY